jgi:hypothetical protein
MIMYPILEKVDRKLAEKLIKIFRKKGWEADSPTSFPYSEVLVRVEENIAKELRRMFEANAVRNEYGIAIEIKNLRKISRRIPTNKEALLTLGGERKSIPITTPTGERKLLMAVKGGKHIPIFPRKATSPGAGKPLLGEVQPLVRKLRELGIVIEMKKSRASIKSPLSGKLYLKINDKIHIVTIEEAKEIIRNLAKEKGIQ